MVNPEDFVKYPAFILLTAAGILFLTYVNIKPTPAYHIVSSPHTQLQQIPHYQKHSEAESGDSTFSFSTLKNFEDEEVRVDKRVKSVFTLLNETQYTLRNFPIQAFTLDRKVPSVNQSCATFPTLYNIEFDNNWQMLHTPKGTVYIYGAYYDNRNLTITAPNMMGPVVRILGMMDTNLRSSKQVRYYCQLWFDRTKEPIISPVIDKKFYWQYTKGKLQMFLFTCKSSNTYNNQVPSSVSIVQNPCDNATNNLRVQYEKASEKKGFAVCVKGLDFIQEDHSVRLVEWIELLHILGADKIFIYELSEHSNSSKVLRYYENTDYVDVTPLTLPGGLPNDPRLRHIYLQKRIADKRNNEMLPYNDCLYRNMYKYKYLAMLDPDETVVPLKALNYDELTTQLQSEYGNEFDQFTAFCFRNTYFFSKWMKNKKWFPNIPKFMHELQHVYRSRNYTDKRLATKCFHNTERVITVHNHFPVHCFEKCKNLFLKTDVAQLQHYRQDCPSVIERCSTNFGRNPVLDNNLWRFKKELINKTVGVLRDLELISSSYADKLSANLQDS